MYWLSCHVDNVSRAFRWTKDDETRLTGLNEDAKNLKTPSKWRWAAKEGTEQFENNRKRMQFLVEHELETVIKHCNNCKCTGILVGMDQVECQKCIDCVGDSCCRSENLKTERESSWLGRRTTVITGLPQSTTAVRRRQCESTVQYLRSKTSKGQCPRVHG